MGRVGLHPRLRASGTQVEQTADIGPLEKPDHDVDAIADVFASAGLDRVPGDLGRIERGETRLVFGAPPELEHREVRDPESGQDIVLNLTTGMGGTLIVGDEDPARPGPGTDFVTPEERVLHVEELRPEICTLDCGTMNFGDEVAMNIPSHLAVMAERVRAVGVKPEIEVFDMGQIWLGKQLIADGVIDSPPMFQLCMGIPWGVESETRTMALMRDMLPDDAIWAGFGISRMAFPMVAQSMILGGHCRVGLEDNLYLEKGVYATNGQLVEKAIGIINALGGRVLRPQEARDKLGLTRQW